MSVSKIAYSVMYINFEHTSSYVYGPSKSN